MAHEDHTVSSVYGLVLAVVDDVVVSADVGYCECEIECECVLTCGGDVSWML